MLVAQGAAGSNEGQGTLFLLLLNPHLPPPPTSSYYHYHNKNTGAWQSFHFPINPLSLSFIYVYNLSGIGIAKKAFYIDFQFYTFLHLLLNRPLITTSFLQNLPAYHFICLFGTYIIIRMYMYISVIISCLYIFSLCFLFGRQGLALFWWLPQKPHCIACKIFTTSSPHMWPKFTKGNINWHFPKLLLKGLDILLWNMRWQNQNLTTPALLLCCNFLL